MCGIAGYSSSSVSDSLTSWLHHACRTLAHRGPDGSGIFDDVTAGVGLAHTRLAILDLSECGIQPMSSSCRRFTIVFNGEIYNYQSLRASLQQKGWSFNSTSDTEVLLALYQEYGLTDLSYMLNLLQGIFCFAIWDSVAQELLLARDPFGVKPLYYSQSDGRFLFSSELKALVAQSSSIDLTAVDLYLSYLWSPGERTPDSSIKKMAPGYYYRLHQGSLLQRVQWYFLPVASTPSLYSSDKSSPKSVTHFTDDLQFYLRQAVHRQMVSDVPVGAFLSGGVDSSAIVAFAREINPDLRCFTIDISGVSDEGFSQDLPYARRVANYLGVPLDVVHIDSSLMANRLEDLVWQLDEPIADPAALNVYFISQTARQQGFKVLLSGSGGDDLFTGYRRHLALSYEHLWSWLPRNLRLHLRQFTSSLPQDHFLFRRLRKAFSGAHLEGDSRLINYFRWIDRHDLDALYTPEFHSAIRQSNADDPMLSYLANLPDDLPSLERMLSLEQRFFLTDHNLTYTDKMSMASGVEVRVPFLDLDLVQYAAGIPSKYKQRGREGKWILKKAIEPYLPYDVIYRPKTGFGAPLRRWLRGELRDWLASTLSPERLRRRGLFDPMAVQRLMVANQEGHLDASYTLLSLACIEIWCSRFIDQSASPVSSHSL